MTTSTCRAAEFLRSGGPALIPLRACCAAAVIRSATAHSPATELSTAPFVCLAAGLSVPAEAWLAEGVAAAGLSVPAQAWLAEGAATAGLSVPAEAWLAEGAAAAGLSIRSELRPAGAPAIAGAECVS